MLTNLLCQVGYLSTIVRLHRRDAEEAAIVSSVQLSSAVDAVRRWRLSGTDILEVAGCIDVDPNFSLVMSMISLRRLAVGPHAELRIASRYESTGRQFAVDLQVNQAGFVVE